MGFHWVNCVHLEVPGFQSLPLYTFRAKWQGLLKTNSPWPLFPTALVVHESHEDYSPLAWALSCQTPTLCMMEQVYHWAYTEWRFKALTYERKGSERKLEMVGVWAFKWTCHIFFFLNRKSSSSTLGVYLDTCPGLDTPLRRSGSPPLGKESNSVPLLDYGESSNLAYYVSIKEIVNLWAQTFTHTLQ